MDRSVRRLALVAIGSLLAASALTPAQADGAREEYQVVAKGEVSRLGLRPDPGRTDTATVTLTRAQAARLADRADVEAILSTRSVAWLTPAMKAASSTGAKSWGLDRIDQRSRTLDGTYKSSAYSGSGTTVVVIDSGLNPSSQFSGRVVAGTNYVPDQSSTDTIDCGGYGGTDHGTHVAGTAVGSTYGVARSAKIRPMRILDCSGNGSPAALYQALDDTLTWARSKKLIGRVVVNFSGGALLSEMEDDLASVAAIESKVRQLVTAGIPVVVAAGNSGHSASLETPARVKEAIVVGATDRKDHRASFSNYGSSVDLFAPGVDIPSVVWQNDVGVGSGTSMAAPHVAGVLARDLQRAGFKASTATDRLISDATRGVVSSTKGAPDRLLYIPTRPRAASSVSISRSDSKHTVTLRWKAASTVPGFAVTGYVVERDGKRVTLKSSARSHTWTKVKPGATVTVSVRAVSKAASGSSTRRTTTMRALPGKPSIGTASSGSTKDSTVSVTARWKKPSKGGGAINGYLVTAKRKSDGSKVTVTVSASTREAKVKGLKRGSTYIVYVKARNAAGVGAPSASSSKVTAR